MRDMDPAFIAVTLGISIYFLIFMLILYAANTALRRSRQPVQGFYLRGWIAVGLSVLGFITEMRVSWDTNGKGLDVNLKWIYIVPFLLSCWALVNHFKLRRAQAPLSSPPAT